MLRPWSEHFPSWDVPRRIAAPLADVLAPSPRDEAELAFARAVEALPKVELHVHMEAAVPSSFYRDLNARARRFAPDDLPSDRAPFPSLDRFIAAWLDNCSLIDAETLFREMAKAFVAQRAAQRIVYSEAHVSPFDFSHGRRRFGGTPLDFRLALESYLAGLDEGLAAHPEVDARLIVDTIWISRDDEMKAMLADLRAVLGSRVARRGGDGDPLVVAIGMGGPEVVKLAEGKRWFVEGCRELGLKLDIHSGETTTLAEHKHAVETLRPDRVGHGIAGAAEAWFHERGVAACPTSNLLTGSFKGPLADHPVKRMVAAGIPVCVNTDDPLLFGTSLTLEFVALRRALGWDVEMVRELTQKAREMAFGRVRG